MKKFIASVTAAAALAGCYIPEQFTADVKFTEKGAYTVNFDGTVINGAALMAMAQAKRPLNTQENASIEKSERDTWAKDKSVKFSYKGNGRTQIQSTIFREPGQRLSLFDMLTVSTDKQGITTISSPKMTAKDKKMLADAGINIKGSFTVELPKNAEVISHNADSEPKFFGLFGAYKWSVADPDKAPQMKVRFK